MFREFLRSEYSEENMLFWLACEELKKLDSAEQVEEKARLIYEDYISILSPKEVTTLNIVLCPFVLQNNPLFNISVFPLKPLRYTNDTTTWYRRAPCCFSGRSSMSIEPTVVDSSPRREPRATVDYGGMSDNDEWLLKQQKERLKSCYYYYSYITCFQLIGLRK